MAEVFLNGGRHKVDAKGRVSIPSGFRSVMADCDPNWTEGLSPQFYIVFGDTRRDYLECFTVEAMDEVITKIKAMPRGSKNRKILEFVYFQGSQKMSVDDTGRIVLSQKLRDRIGLTGEAEFVAAGDTFQIWHPDKFAEFADDQTSALEELPPDMDVAELLDGVDL